jgi:hypothetical protein
MEPPVSVPTVRSSQSYDATPAAGPLLELPGS